MAPLLSHLPTEILVAICSHIECQTCLSALVRVSRHMHDLALPYLYRRVEISLLDDQPPAACTACVGSHTWLRDQRPLPYSRTAQPAEEAEREDTDRTGFGNLARPWPFLSSLARTFVTRPAVAKQVKHFTVRSGGSLDRPCPDDGRTTAHSRCSSPADKIEDADGYAKALRMLMLQWTSHPAEVRIWQRELGGDRYADAYIAVILACLEELESLDLELRSVDAWRGEYLITSRVLQGGAGALEESSTEVPLRLTPSPRLKRLAIRGHRLYDVTGEDFPMTEVFAVASVMEQLEDLTIALATPDTDLPPRWWDGLNTDQHKVPMQFRHIIADRYKHDLPASLKRLEFRDCKMMTHFVELEKSFSQCLNLTTVLIVFPPDWAVDRHTWTRLQVEADELLETLLPLAPTLRNLTLGFTRDDLDLILPRVQPGTKDLTMFSSLKRLHLDYEWYGRRNRQQSPGSDMSDIDYPYPEVENGLANFLPTAIEELRLMCFRPWDGMMWAETHNLLARKSRFPAWRTLIIEIPVSDLDDEWDKYMLIIEQARSMGMECLILGTVGRGPCRECRQGCDHLPGQHLMTSYEDAPSDRLSFWASTEGISGSWQQYLAM